MNTKLEKKLLVTHISPDMDAITSCWLIQKYLPGWDEAELAFVGAGQTYKDMKPDEDPNIIHVDTGLGRFDHHQFKERLSASLVIFKHLKQQDYVRQYDLDALERLVKVVTTIDNFGEVDFPDPTADVYDFTLYQLIEGLKPTLPENEQIINFGYTALEGILQVLKNKLRAEKDLPNGLVIHTTWGKALVIESKNEEIMKLAQKKGFVLVARKDPSRGFIRIKCLPEEKLDLTSLYQQIRQRDKQGTWFLHASKHMLLNGSSKNPRFVPSSLTFEELIEIIRKM